MKSIDLLLLFQFAWLIVIQLVILPISLIKITISILKRSDDRVAIGALVMVIVIIDWILSVSAQKIYTVELK